jgi:hypothetical protein
MLAGLGLGLDVALSVGAMVDVDALPGGNDKILLRPAKDRAPSGISRMMRYCALRQVFALLVVAGCSGASTPASRPTEPGILSAYLPHYRNGEEAAAGSPSRCYSWRST